MLCQFISDDDYRHGPSKWNVLGSLKTNGWRKINKYRHFDRLDPYRKQNKKFLNKNIRSRAETKKNGIFCCCCWMSGKRRDGYKQKVEKKKRKNSFVSGFILLLFLRAMSCTLKSSAGCQQTTSIWRIRSAHPLTRLYTTHMTVA